GHPRHADAARSEKTGNGPQGAGLVGDMLERVVEDDEIKASGDISHLVFQDTSPHRVVDVPVDEGVDSERPLESRDREVVYQTARATADIQNARLFALLRAGDPVGDTSDRIAVAD